MHLSRLPLIDVPLVTLLDHNETFTRILILSRRVDPSICFHRATLSDIKRILANANHVSSSVVIKWGQAPIRTEIRDYEPRVIPFH